MEKSVLTKHQFAVGNKTVSIYPAAALGKAAIYLNTFAPEEGDSVYRALRNANCPDFSFISISGLNWNHDMAPWDMPPISRDDVPCTGGADEYLQLLTHEIVPRAEALLPGSVLWRGLAGYSLAGLFALYSLYHTAAFPRAASVSGSLWFPGLLEYVASHEMKSRLQHLYFSLGDRENRTRNPYLKEVRRVTEELETFYKDRGFDTVFQLNQGSHFHKTCERTTAGIAWLLSR